MLSIALGAAGGRAVALPGQAVPDGATEAAPGAVERSLRFNFKNATIDQVLDWFSRETGLPIVKEADVPDGKIDYLSPESYTVPEALRVLNILLQSRGIMLRPSRDMLYLQKMENMNREAVGVYVGTFPDDVPDEEIVTFVLPLNVASAVTLQEKLAEMVASYGSVQALSQQNAIVITETAAQVRRLVKILEQLDREDPEGIIEIVKIRYVKASVIMEPLKALLAEKVEKYVVDAKGKQVKIDEETMPGLNITVDDRTNSIVAKGVQSRIDKLKEVIGILDVPDGSGIGQRTMRTLTLLTLVPSQAVQRLDQLFARVPEAERPTVVALDEVGKITIVGTETQITEGAALIREIDGGGPSTGDEATGITVFTLEHAAPDAVIAAVKGLLNRRQAQTLKLLASPDGRSLVVSGPAADVAAVSALLPSLDASRPVDREVRLVQIDARDPADVLERARRLYDRQVDAGDPQFALVSEFDDASRTITLIGPRPALDRFTSTLRTVESGLIVERETRQLELVNATPSEVASALTTLAAPLLAPTDGTRYVAPTVQPIDALDLLLVTALPEQFGTLLSIVKTLDRSGPNDFQFRVVTLAGVTNVDLLLTKASDVFARRTLGYPAGEITAPEVEFDALTGNLMLTGETRSVQEYETALAEARRLLPPAREGRMIPLSVAKASDIVGSLRELLAKTALVDPARTVPAPTIEAVERTNSLYVVAEPAQHQMIERTIALLDVIEPTDLPPLRLIQVRAADATQLADLLRRRYNARPNDQRREKPVDIDADPGTNALIVTAHEDVFEEVRTFVEGVNRAGDTRAERETMLFPLKRARAQDLAQAMDRLYPQPPMPLDARGRPLPHLQQPKEVQVSAEPATNTLIVEAPAERRAQFTALVEQLDRVELPPQAELRTYRIRRGDPTMIAQTLSDLARRGVLSAPPLDGGKPVDVTVQAEPLSRTLIVAGDAATFEKVEQMLVEIGNVPVERSLRVFEVNGVDARDLAARAQRLYAEQTAELFDAGAVSVEVDTDGSTVLVVADDEAMIRFAAILTELQNAVGPPPDVRLVALEDADATEVVAFLESMATNDLALAGMRGGAKPVFQAITRTNSVLVSAQPEQHSVIRSLISSFDVPEPQAMPPLRILQLRSADANNLATALTRQYGQRPSEERRDKPVSIAADPNTNTLMVAAHPDVLPEIQAIVEELNDTTRVGAEGREIRIFPLKVARAEELAKTIDEMFPEPPMPVDRRGQPLPHLRESREIVVRADVQTNALIVDAPVQRMVGFETLVEQLDRQRIVDETEVRTYRVVHADVDGLAGTLNRLAQTGALNPAGNDRRIAITITAEPVSQTLLVSGPTAIFDRVEQVLEDLDVRRMAPATTLKFFKLRFARAESLAPMLREILTARIAEDVPEAGANIASLLNVSAETKTNTLIISAPETVMPVVDALIAQLDDQSASLSDPVIRVRPLNFADPADVSQSLVQALPNMVSPVTGEPMNVKLIPSPGSNAIIMVGVAGELDEVETLIEPLDARPSMDAVGAKTFTLEHADAAVVAPIVQRLLTDQQATDPMIVRERIRRSRGPIDLVAPIRVEADARTNTLIVSGPQRTVGLAEALITQLDAPDESANRTYATYTPVNAGAAAMVPSVKRVIESTRPNGRRSTLEIMLEPQSGAIVVIGSASDTEQAVELLRRWDDEALTPPQMDFRMVTLTHSDASVVAQALGPMLRDRSRWPQALRAAMQAGLAVSEPTVTADPRANRVLVTAPQDLMAVAS
ncbi:MAG: hypothetical protein KDA25_13535, partial [Phycisphaerales bacterium]|nr:hypothetical protein [Phycisphaerales bacterium]